MLNVSRSEYLGISIEYFDSLGGDEEIHLCHGLRLTLRGLHTHRHTHTATVTKQQRHIYKIYMKTKMVSMKLIMSD